MPGRQVLLSVTGKTQGQDEPEEAVRLLTTGVLTGGREAWRIDYTETQPDSQAHDVTLTLGKGVVTMERHGAFATSMVFEKGCRFEGSYDTPYGALDMGIFPTQVKYSVDDARGEVLLKYQLDIQGQYSSMREMRIRFAPSNRA